MSLSNPREEESLNPSTPTRAVVDISQTVSPKRARIIPEEIIATTMSKDDDKFQLTDQTYFLPQKQIFLAFVGLSLALGCALLDHSIVSTALPNISSELHGGRDSSWVATAYFLTSLAFTPLYGRWSDVFGRKAVLLGSLGIFWIFSLGCALSQSMLQLIIFRALKGIGGGALMTMVFIIIADIVPLAKRGKYQSLTEIVSAISNGLGPVLGGVFSESTTWRWCFWINLPICGLAIVTTIWLIPTKSVEGNMKEKFLKIDYVGSALAIVASTLTILWLTWGGVKYDWVSAPVLVPLFLSLLAFVAFFLWEAKFARLPIVPMEMFKNISLVGIFIASCLAFTTLFINIFYVPQLLQLLRNTSPINTGILMLSFLLPVPVSISVHGYILNKFGIYKPSIVIGFAMWTIAQGLATTLDINTSDAKIVGILVFAACGSGGTFQTTLIATHAAVPRSEMAVATGVRNFFRLLASAMGLAIGSTLINNTLRSSMLRHATFTSSQMTTILDDPISIHDSEAITLTLEQKTVVLDAYTQAFQIIFYMSMGLCAAGVLVSLVLIKQVPLHREDEKDMKEKTKESLKEKKVRRRDMKNIKDQDIERHDVEKGGLEDLDIE